MPADYSPQPSDRSKLLQPAVARPARSRIPPIYLVAAAIVVGDGLGTQLTAIEPWLVAIMALGALLLFLGARPAAGLIVALAALLLAAAVLSGGVYAPPRARETIRGFPETTPVDLQGVLDREPERTLHGVRLYLRLREAWRPGSAPRPATGEVRITLARPESFALGERIRVLARLRFPRNYGDPGEFNYAAYMARQRIAATAFLRDARSITRLGYHPVPVWSTVAHLRSYIRALIDRALPRPENAEMRALIIGDRGGIRPGLRNIYARAGMAHLLVISGLHLGFVAGAAFAIIRLLCCLFPALLVRGYANKLAAAGAGMAVLAYAAIAGTHLSTLRALIMVLCYVAAVIADRGREVLASLALAALVICLAIPASSADVGFQLSFVAVAGIVLGMRRFLPWWRRIYERFGLSAQSRLSRAVGCGTEILAASIAVSFFALIATAPLTAFYFNQFSVVGLAANALVVPIMAFGGAVLGLIAVALSAVWTTGAIWLLQLGGLAIMLANRLAAAFAALPDAWVRIFTPTIVELLICYALLALWLLASIAAADDLRVPAGADWRDRWRRWAIPAASVLFLAIAVDAGWWLHARYFDSRLRVTFLSVGQGDAAVVQFPGSVVMLIDGGGRIGESFDQGERIVAPFLWSRKILHVDYLALSHPDIDHFGGFIFVARNFHPRWFWTTGATSHDLYFRTLLTALHRAGVRQIVMNASSPARRFGGVLVRCLGPAPGYAGSHNNDSMVLELSMGRTSFLFTGDLEKAGEHRLLARDPMPHATVLKVPHHGSRSSSSASFVAAVDPAFAIISAGYHNRYRYPASAVVARYHAVGASVLVTASSGAVAIATDGHHLALSTGSHGSWASTLPHRRWRTQANKPLFRFGAGRGENVIFEHAPRVAFHGMLRSAEPVNRGQRWSHGYVGPEGTVALQLDVYHGGRLP